MRAFFGFPLLLATSLGLPAPGPEVDGASLTAEQLAAFDPTRLGRAICRGAGSGPGTLEARLLQASEAVEAGLGGQERMGLYEGLAPTDIPAPELKGVAARYFAQGLALTYGFNHKAAIRSFRLAQEADPQCALCFWGEAMANGPNINAGMGSAENRAALAALARAHELIEDASPAVRALIEAQTLRYSADGGNRAELDAAYADAMAKLATRHPDSDDIAVLAGEAAMNTSPWDYWELLDEPRPRIAGAISQIEKVVGRNPRHPQASHLYIHLMEATQPGKAEAAADRLAAGAAPGALGHLVHMPSHIYYRIGRYADSMKANVAAVRADEAYLASVGDDGLYRFGYYPHNVHFLLASAQMMGDMRRTVTEEQRLATFLNSEVARDIPWIQAIHAAPSFALAQYSSPDAILALTTESSPLAYVEAMRHYARAIAHAQRGDHAAFARELAAIERQADAPDTLAMVDAGFPAPDLVRMAALVAQARMEHWQDRPAAAILLYEKAEAIEATLPYTEPPYWYYPIAQSRGAALYADGRFREARNAFNKALFMAPNSGWALYGLAQTEQRLGHRLEAQAANAALRRIWRGDWDWLEMNRL